MNLPFDVIFLGLTTVDSMTTGVPLLLLFFSRRKGRQSDVRVNLKSIPWKKYEIRVHVYFKSTNVETEEVW